MPQQWLAELGLRSPFSLAQGGYRTAELPEWVAFLIWAGWWMRRAQVPRTRTFLVALLADRSSAASLVAFGALLGSLGRTGRTLAWDDFLRLRTGETVYLRMKERRGGKSTSVEGRMAPGGAGAEIRTIVLQSDNPRFRGASITPSSKAFFEYDASRERHLTPRRARRLLGISKVLSEMSADFDESWMAAPQRESAIITNRALWERRNAGLRLSIEGGGDGEPAEGLLDILMPGGAIGGGGRTLVLSPRTAEADSSAIPVGILDGADAFRAMDSIQCPNVVILLEESEYDRDAEDRLTRLVAARSDDALPIPPDAPEAAPAGVEMTMFAVAAA